MRVVRARILSLANSEFAPNAAARRLLAFRLLKEGIGPRTVEKKGGWIKLVDAVSDGARKTPSAPYSLCDAVVGELLTLIPL